MALEVQIKALAQSYKAIMRQYGQVLNARENIKEEGLQDEKSIASGKIIEHYKNNYNVLFSLFTELKSLKAASELTIDPRKIINLIEKHFSKINALKSLLKRINFVISQIEESILAEIQKQIESQWDDYTIIIESFAPFGLGFDGDGDNTRFSRNGVPTSRISASTVINPMTGLIIELPAVSNASEYPILGTETSTDNTNRTIINNFDINADSTETNLDIDIHVSGNNPLIPWEDFLSPDIDIDTNIVFIANKNAQQLQIALKQRGDHFPAAQTRIRDSQGTNILINVSAAWESFLNLIGHNELLMGRTILIINTNEQGHFLSVIDIKGRQLTIDEWNNIMESIAPK